MARFVGIDVSAKTLDVVTRENDIASECCKFENTVDGHKALIKHIKAKHEPTESVYVCLEATGIYHFDCAVTLSKTDNIEVMVVNPKAAKSFAGACMQRSKTDAIDANMLADFCQRMEFKAWSCPKDNSIALRSYGREISSFTEAKTQLKNQLHALKATKSTVDKIILVHNKMIGNYNEAIEELKKEALIFINKNPEIKELFELLLSIKGIGETSAIMILGELLVLPEDMTAKQWVAHSGLNPVAFESGTSVNKKTRISRVGNRHLRRALYMPAMAAATHDDYVRGYYHHQINDNGLYKRQALCAVMRKLLHAIHGILSSRQPYDSSRFYKTPLAKVNKKKSTGSTTDSPSAPQKKSSKCAA